MLEKIIFILFGFAFCVGGVFFLFQKQTLEKNFLDSKMPVPFYGFISKVLGVVFIILGVVIVGFALIALIHH